MLSEGEPETLMAKYNCNNVEEVFLLLSRKQQEGNIESSQSQDIEMEEVSLTETCRDKDKYIENYVSPALPIFNIISCDQNKPKSHNRLMI